MVQGHEPAIVERINPRRLELMGAAATCGCMPPHALLAPALPMITPSRILLSLSLILPAPVAAQGQVIFEQLLKGLMSESR